MQFFSKLFSIYLQISRAVENNRQTTELLMKARSTLSQSVYMLMVLFKTIEIDLDKSAFTEVYFVKLFIHSNS
jgi:hypothetical protein